MTDQLIPPSLIQWPVLSAASQEAEDAEAVVGDGDEVLVFASRRGWRPPY